MPYELVPAAHKKFYVATKDTGAKHSKKPLPRKRAVAQMRALYANVKDTARK